MGFRLSDFSHSFICSKCLKASTTGPESCSVSFSLYFLLYYQYNSLFISDLPNIQVWSNQFDFQSVWLSSGCSLVYWKLSNVYVEGGCEEANWQDKSARTAVWGLSCQDLTGWPHMCFQSKLRKEHFRAPREHNYSIAWTVLWHLRHLQGSYTTPSHMDKNVWSILTSPQLLGYWSSVTAEREGKSGLRKYNHTNPCK